MATRAAIAAKDRQSRERIQDKEIQQRKRELQQRYQQMEREHVRGSAQAAGTILKGIASFQHNEPDFYKKFKVAESMASVPTFFRTGLPIKPGWLHSHTLGFDKCVDNLPGVIVFRYYSTLPNGYGTFNSNSEYYKQSPINGTLLRFMAELRKLNSRIGDYDPSDVGFYFYGLSDIMENILMLSKAIKIYNTWYSNNANFCDLMLRAVGFNPTDFKANYNDYKAFCIKVIQMFNANAVLPKTLTFLQRRAWISSVVIRDHATPTAQLYTFRKMGNLTLNEDETGLDYADASGDFYYVGFRNLLLGQMERLFNSVGMVTITADLRAAFKPGDLLTIPDLEPGSGIYYSESIYDLEQIHNIVTLPVSDGNFMKKDTTPAGLTRLNITQDSAGYLFQGVLSGGFVTPPYLQRGNYTAGEYSALANALSINQTVKFLNFYEREGISNDDILEATRLRVVLGDDQTYSVGQGITPYICGTEIIAWGEVWVRDYSDNTNHYYAFATDIISDAYDPIPEEMMGMLSRFDWLPVFRHSYYIAGDVITLFYNTIGEIDHAVNLTDSNLEWLHEGCAYSLFFVDASEFGSVKY